MGNGTACELDDDDRTMLTGTELQRLGCHECHAVWLGQLEGWNLEAWSCHDSRPAANLSRGSSFRDVRQPGPAR